MTNSSLKNRKLTVRFDLPANKVTLIKYPSQIDIKAAWYSSDDKRDQKLVLRKDLKKAAKIIRSSLIENITDVELCETLGLENIISSDMAKQTLMQRNRHREAVLDEQHRQDCLGIIYEEALDNVSELCSRRSRQRAHDIAFCFSHITF